MKHAHILERKKITFSKYPLDLFHIRISTGISVPPAVLGLGAFLASFMAAIISSCCLRHLPLLLRSISGNFPLYSSARVPSTRCPSTSNTSLFLFCKFLQTYELKNSIESSYIHICRQTSGYVLCPRN